MKKETGVIIAGIFGFFAVIGFTLVKRLLSNKDYDSEYSDYHRHLYDDDENSDLHHGIEYLALK